MRRSAAAFGCRRSHACPILLHTCIPHLRRNRVSAPLFVFTGGRGYGGGRGSFRGSSSYSSNGHSNNSFRGAANGAPAVTATRFNPVQNGMQGHKRF